MDYKIKYLKYKMKYLNLLGGTKNFKTIKNNGGDTTGNYSNQCMWISIINFLNQVLGNTLNLDTIREIASDNNTQINGTREMFDTDKHMASLLNITNTYDLQIHIYISFRNKAGNLVIPDEPNWIIGNNSAPNVVSIVSYGRHFELITSIGRRKLYRGVIKGIESDFKPNIELATGKKIKKDIKHEQLNEINDLLDTLSNLERIIVDIKQNIEKNDREIENLEQSFLYNQKKYSQEETDIQISLVSSFQEYKNILETTSKNLKEELESLKKLHKDYELVLSKYF